MDKILLAHGSGGTAMHKLIREYFVPEFDMKSLETLRLLICPIHLLGLPLQPTLMFISPVFSRGNIGELAVYGTVNDLSMVGAKPLCMSAGLILEEGFLMNDLKKILASMADAAKRSGVKIIAGDTKVVNRGKGDGIFINTSGIGILDDGVNISPSNIKSGDKIIVSGTIGNHGAAVMAERNGAELQSSCPGATQRR